MELEAICARAYKNMGKTALKRPEHSKMMSGSGNPMFGKPNKYKGKKRSDDVRLKISLAHKGKKFTDEHRHNLSLAKSGKPNFKRRGKNHPLWKGGVTPVNQKIRESIEMVNWRRAVFKRDNFTCQMCGKRGGKLQADHIKPFVHYRHLRTELSNGRTLCVDCHKKTDTYGYRKNDCLGKKALILGVTGMDGSYLAEFLIDRGYEVHAMLRRSSTFNRQRVEHLRGKIQYHYGDITDPFSIMWMLKKVKPAEIYHLVAQSHVQISWEIPYTTMMTDGIGTLNLLESIRVLGMTKKVKVYNALTSELFSGRETGRQNESTVKDPISPYGSAKLYSYQISKNYRDAYGMFIACGILFNHEGFRRGDNFVTKKICLEAESGEVNLGNVEAQRDWGWSPQYCEGMWMMLQQDKPDDFVLATGETHTIKEFVGWVEKEIGKEIKIIHNQEYDRPNDVPTLCGDAYKAKEVLGWEATIKGKDIVKKIINNDYESN